MGSLALQRLHRRRKPQGVRLSRDGVDRSVLARAEELTEREALRGCDAVHLASALHAGAEALVTADTALIEAAERLGLTVVDARD
jgi:predicted nucleic acid-binding protein